MPKWSNPMRGSRRVAARLAPGAGQAGLTLIELIVAFSLLLILSVMALPVARVKVAREKEQRLRQALSEIRQAIDRHKDMADEGRLGEIDPDNHGYPTSLEVLVEGVETSVDGGLGGLPSSRTGLGNSTNQAFGQQSNRPGGFQSGFGQQGSFGSGGRLDRNAPMRQDDPLSRDDPLGRADPLARDDDAPGTVRFLRSIPVDPMTGRREWGLLSVSDRPESRSWSGRNVFDVYSLSNDIALDGTRYGEW